MDRLTLKLGKVAILLAPLFLILPFALAEEAKYVGEDYYGNDINAAVMEADQNKRQLNYNKQHWFNRSTSKSFELPQLEGTELEQERLEGALGATAAGGTKLASPELPSKEQAERIQKDNLQDNTQQASTINLPSNQSLGNIENKLPTNTYHEFSRGDIVTTNGALSNGSIISTPRP
jgi:hypothetical protein